MLQLDIKSFKQNVLKIYTIFLEKLLKKIKLKYSVISLPTKKKKITLLKSPHVYKKAREQFQLNIYKKTIKIESFKNINNLNNFILSKPKSINITIKYIGK